MLLIFLLLGMLTGILLLRYIIKPKNQIQYLRERDGRGHEFDVAREDAISLETSTNPPLRFFKFGRAYEFIKRGRAFTRFFGKEGTAYTWRLEGFAKTNPEGETKPLTLEFPTLEGAVKHCWGNETYEAVQEELKAKLRNNKMYVTVNLEPGITPEGYEPITEQTITKKADEDMASLIGREVKEAQGSDWKMILIMMLAGMGILAIASKLFGWW